MTQPATAIICPAGQRLHPYSSSLLRGLKKINYVNKLACDDCPIRPRCTGGRFRTVSRLENEAVLDRMQAASGAAALTSSTGGARRSNIRSARSSNG